MCNLKPRQHMSCVHVCQFQHHPSVSDRVFSFHRLILIVYVFGVIFSQAVHLGKYLLEWSHNLSPGTAHSNRCFRNDFLQDQEPDAPSVTEQGREVLQAFERMLPR